jgi:O-antigen ligase
MYNVGLSSNGRFDPARWLSKITEQWGQRGQARGTVPTANLVGLLGAVVALFCLLALPQLQYWNFRVTLYLIVIIWTIIRPRVALYLLPLAIPWGSLDVIGSNITSADLLVALLAASWLLGCTLRPFIAQGIRNGGPLDREAFNIPLPLALSAIVLLLTMLISFVGTTNLADSIKEVVKWSELLVILLLGTQYIRTRRHIWTLAVMLCLAGLSQALFGYAQILFDLGPASFMRDASLRVYGTFGQPNPYAGYINMTLALALALLLLGHGWKTRLLAACIVLPLAGVEIYSQSKGGWIALGAAAVFIVIVGFPQLRLLARIGWIGLIGIIAAYLAGKFPVGLIEPILTKIGVIDISFTAPSNINYANSERVAHWLAGINMFQDHPFFGVGMGNYQDVYAQYHVGIFVLPLGHAHNYYINIAAEAGILGLTAFLLFLIAVFTYGGRSYRAIAQQYQQLVKRLHQPPSNTTTVERHLLLRRLGMLVNDRALAIGLIASLVTVCVHNLVDNLYVHAMTGLFALLIVLLVRLNGATDSKA